MENTQNDLVSIIMPSYNTGKYIAEAIESVCCQTYKNWELLIVDDYSTDETMDILNSYIKNYGENKIRIFVNKTNLGAACSRNLAIREAKGRWVAFLDSDDIWVKDKLEKQIDFMKKQSCFFSYTYYEEIDENSNSLNKIVTGPEHISKLKMYLYCWPGCLTVMYDMKKIGLVQIKDIKKNNDYLMWLQIIKKADCYAMKEVLSKYRRRQGSISNYSCIKLIKWHFIMFHFGEERGKLISVFLTMLNLFFGMIKKMIFIKKIDRYDSLRN